MGTGSAIALSLIERSKFVNDKPSEIRARVKALLDAQEIRLRDIERITSFKGPTISQHLSGTYTGDVEKLDDALMRFYRSWMAKNAIVQTKVVEEIHAILHLVWVRKEIGCIRGKFGRGKTKAASSFIAKNDQAILVTLSGVTSPTELLHAVADALGIRSHMIGSRSDKLQAIIRNLQRSPRLIIIDEADELRPRSLALLRDIHGEGTERCGIVLIATDRLNKLLENPELGYLRRRITIKRDIEEINYTEAKGIADMWPHDLENDELKTAWSWSLKHFGIASLVNLMMRAYDVMQARKGKEITGDDIEAAYGYLID
jgi:DNA transposition AAA+ family ATPase